MTSNNAAATQPQQAGGGAEPFSLGLPPWISRGSVLMVMLAVLAPAAIPVIIFGLPILALVMVWRMKVQEEANAEAIAPQLVKVDEKKSEEKPLGVKKEDSAESKPAAVPASAQTPASSAAPAVGGAAILAKLRAAKQEKQGKQRNNAAIDQPVVVMYASQTGTAAEVAKNIGSSIHNEGIKSRVVPMNEVGAVSSLSKEATPFIVYVVSSTGDGEAPDNATKFYNDLRNKNRNEPGSLRGIQFTGIGLGDSNYTRFMHVPRVVKNRFLELGATAFHPCAEADEVDGIEGIIDSWTEKLLLRVKEVVSKGTERSAEVSKPSKEMALPACGVEVLWIDEGDADIYRDTSNDAEVKEISAASPFLAPISAARYLTTTASDVDRRVVHIQFDLSGSGIEYGPGDSLGVLPENDSALVDALLAHLGLDGSKWFALTPQRDGANAKAERGAGGVSPSVPRPLQHIKWPCSVRDAFLHGVDLTGPPKKSMLRVLAEYCDDDGEKAKLMHLCSREGRQEYMETIIKGRRAFIDVLFENKSCKPPLDALLDALSPLAPRMYSISSASSAASAVPTVPGPHKAEVAFTAVQYPTVSGGTRKGVATWWLENMAMCLLDNSLSETKADPRVPLYLRKGGSFSPPASVEVPWIMIGPGTGVSPFRGFLQQRRIALSSSSSPGDCWLFFGCRDKTKDYLYGDELEAFAADGTLTKLCVAESRKNPDKKVYVQHLMLQHKDRLRKLIVEQDAYIFICGDGHGMAKDVHSTLVEIISSGEGQDKFDAKEADDMLTAMTREGRYVKDVWS